MKIQGVGLIDFKKQNHKTNNVRFNFCAKNKFDSFERTTKTPTITTALKMQGEAMAKEGKAVYKKACKVQKDVQKNLDLVWQNFNPMLDENDIEIYDENTQQLKISAQVFDKTISMREYYDDKIAKDIYISGDFVGVCVYEQDGKMTSYEFDRETKKPISCLSDSKADELSLIADKAYFYDKNGKLKTIYYDYNRTLGKISASEIYEFKNGKLINFIDCASGIEG